MKFTGGVAGTILRMTLLEESSGSPVLIDCDVDAAKGSVVLPAAFFALLQKGDASLVFTSAGMQHVHADPWDVEASAPGLVTQKGTLLDTLPIKLKP